MYRENDCEKDIEKTQSKRVERVNLRKRESKEEEREKREIERRRSERQGRRVKDRRD
jgi:hypothetical protein